MPLFAGQRYVQDPTVDSPCSASVGHISTLDPIAESPSSSEKAALATGAPTGLASRPPVVYPSPTSVVSVSTTPRTSLRLISSRTRHRSAAAAGTPRTPADYGLGHRLQLLRFQDHHLPVAARPFFGPDPCSSDLVQPAAEPHKSPRRRQPRPQPVLPHRWPSLRCSPRSRCLFRQSSLFNNHRLDCRRSWSSLMTIHTSVPASSTTPTPTGRANNAPNPSGPPPYDLFLWAHLHYRRTISWNTYPRPVDHFFQRSLPSLQKASYTPPTTRQFSSSTDHTRLHRSKTTPPCLRPSPHSPAFTSLC